MNGKNIKVSKPDAITRRLQGRPAADVLRGQAGGTDAAQGHALTFGVYDPTLYTSIDFPTDDDLVRGRRQDRRLQAPGRPP